VTEAELEHHIRRSCDRLGLYRFHVGNPRQAECPGGWPDDVIIGDRGVLIRENKSPAGTLTPVQRWIGKRMLDAGLDWAVWTPADAWSGLIDAQLAAVAWAP